jgi:glycerol-3-phosphate dehydrogenase
VSRGQRDDIDLLVVGGGINGVGIARDAAGRGLSVTLCEARDLAAATSSSSTKLVHGGLRYLEYYQFRLVREALIEREVLLRAAPHIIWPLRFVLPHDAGLRPAWMIRAGLFLYDHLGGRELLPGSCGLDLRRDPLGAPLAESVTKGFAYYDCWADDARLVVLNAMDARARGAEILTRTACSALQRVDGAWQASLTPADGGPVRQLKARAVVNAAGPWVSEVLHGVAGMNRTAGLRLVKGSHIVVPRVHEGAQAFIFQNTDRRIVFVIPYEGKYSLIGTTDEPYEGDPTRVEISDGEIDYLLTAVNRYLAEPVARGDIVWSYSGVRPLFDDHKQSASAVTRDYVFDIDAAEGAPPLLSIFGGKITTYRKLAEHALAKLQPLLGSAGRPWTAGAALPGGDIHGANFAAFLTAAATRYPWLPPALRHRYARAYGTRIERLLGSAQALSDLGEDFGEGLYGAELAYLHDEEWARSAEDVLWRRSKLGLVVPPAAAARVQAWFDDRGKVADSAAD